MRSRILFVAILTISFLACACGTQDSRSEEAEASEALLVHSKAKDVTHSEVKGTFQVRYSVGEKYPGDKLIDWLANELNRKGWKPLEYDFLDPNIKLSHVTGWTNFIDSRKPVEYQVHQWLANWKHASGSVVRYQLRYQYPKTSQPDLSTVEVSAVSIPARLVKEAEKFPK